MKKLLLIFLLMPLWCMAQVTDTTYDDIWHIPTGTETFIPKEWPKDNGYKTRLILITKDTVVMERNIGIVAITDSEFNQYLAIDTSIWQRKDTVPIRIRPTEPERPKASGIPITKPYGIYYDEPIDWNKEDTSKVIMLVCDTSTSRYFLVRPKRIGDNFYNDNISWIHGYKVTNYTGSPYYLNDSKERLGENIIVWQTKEL